MRQGNRLAAKSPLDSGSAAIQAIVVFVVIGASIQLLGLAFGAQIQRQGLQAAVDAAAIGANQTMRGLNTGVPCERAKEILTLNMVFLEKCSIVGGETTVSGSKTFLGMFQSATATAAGT